MSWELTQPVCGCTNQKEYSSKKKLSQYL